MYCRDSASKAGPRCPSVEDSKQMLLILLWVMHQTWFLLWKKKWSMRKNKPSMLLSSNFLFCSISLFFYQSMELTEEEQRKQVGGWRWEPIYLPSPISSLFHKVQYPGEGIIIQEIAQAFQSCLLNINVYCPVSLDCVQFSRLVVQVQPSHNLSAVGVLVDAR